jgi:tripartite-type tricarboxylate transporter receptor subunit TctC
MVFRVVNKLDIRHVPFASGPPAVLALLGAQVPIAVVALPSAIAQAKAGQVRALATSTAARLDELPDVPTIRETGLGDVETATSVGFFVPAKTPERVIEKINADISAVLSGGKLDQSLREGGFAKRILTPAQAQAAFEGEIVKWGDVIRSANIKPE